MKKFFKKSIITLGILSLIIVGGVMTPESASAGGPTATINLGMDHVGNSALGNVDPRDMAIRILNIMMTFLGMIAVLIILLGGFKWMTAAGNDDKVAEAKKLLAAGIIGLIIIFASYGIALFVINQMLAVSNQAGGGVVI